MSPPSFHPFHLHLLQSLHSSSNGGGKKDCEDDNGGNEVDAAFWKMVHQFLQEREGLTKQLRHVSSMKRIEQEALLFQKEQHDESTSPPTAKRAKLSPHSSSPLRLSQQPPEPGLKCFGLVGRLVKKRASASETTVQRKTTPYAPILTQVEAEIGVLETKIHKARETLLSHKQQAMEDLLSRAIVEESALLAFGGSHSNNNKNDFQQAQLSLLATNLQLWQMLASDMRQVVQTTTTKSATTSAY
ncbi:expressed unknown protein [Seminavis robusta]|uniref:Uncharacterized protein n=1 Tax=Seminavis robusta TaxID=568900 RepID=A0A9N8ETK0_9STRA|nr:expressed unknown protein [Seminavis robusta]|eukprot:Sro1835_g300560.1 n/a (244) ;mRNA; r:2348-3079